MRRWHPRRETRGHSESAKSSRVLGHEGTNCDAYIPLKVEGNHRVRRLRSQLKNDPASSAQKLRMISAIRNPAQANGRG